ncbi:RNase adapter RapZ [Piscinibacter gummiphilus]|uniref:RNase adaptor protein RapZ n=1 Tax=Piscinibacter gummiphilus TaxID=946333 RepID=A0A1W6L4S7_9BURK|nr:RNase adapter RapZ [Piscinibacter gummiphilus]ARN19315.1 RNase adaptor protein RapZ [Piscinibacter gummiphilus]ATU63983.1 RNase adapter RapZ [Piscinibacter gummiphilus]GLS93058.1 nucleotide-binding protein [Piscinibacter gummiphilus]
MNTPAPGAPDPAALNEVVLVTGISGSGKSVALHALEDAGFFCVDNLPPELLRDFLRLEHGRSQRRVAIAVDVRSAGSLPHLLPLIEELRGEGVVIRSVFLDAGTDALVRRFSESRRPHPLSQQATSQSLNRRREDKAPDGHRALYDAIELERELLAELREISTVVDTSQLRPAQLRLWMRDLVQAGSLALTLVFESFAFKHGVPLDADFVFDVRILPNPYYIRELRAQTGRDDGVIQYLEAQPEVAEMLEQIEAFIARWLPAFENDQRSYLTVAIGCTGGQHRSVYLTETLARRFSKRSVSLIRHRELDARD